MSSQLFRVLLSIVCLPITARAEPKQIADRPAAVATDQSVASAQPSSPQDGESTGGWSLALDGVAFATFDRQGGQRGETELNSQNWFMAAGTRSFNRASLTLSGMISAEPLSVGKAGYPEIFQEGEAYRGLQLTDRQHPHDLIMQLAAAWRTPVGDKTGFTVAGGPVGEAALGPVAFMHRPSSAENPTAPLSHHMFDSTHMSAGVLLVGLDRGPIAVEGSMFRGREPDEHRYDLDLGRLDSWSVRAWFRPGSEWTIQASHGYLHEPEQLEPGDQRRTNASVSWLRQRPAGFTAMTAAAGWNVRRFSTVHALLLEFTHQAGPTSVYSRFEDLTAETEILLFPSVVHRPHPGELVDPIKAFTAGAVRDVAGIRGFKIGIGADVVLYGVPEILQFTHGEHPVSFHVFARVRPRPRGARMWNMTMGQAMTSSGRVGMHH